MVGVFLIEALDGALDLRKCYADMKRKSFINYGVTVSHEAARIAIMDNATISASVR